MKTVVKTPGRKLSNRVIDLPAPTVLRGLPYEGYLALRGNPANDHLRMVYSNGTLQIMSPEFIHEKPSRRVGLVIFVLCQELRTPYEGTQSTTIRRGTSRLKKGHGKEPDQGFYFANVDRIVGKDKIDLDLDPPPDLWIEVDSRAGSQGRLPLYAALGVPEVWRYEARRNRIWFGRLVGETYEAIDCSLALPMLTPALLLEALALGQGVNELEWGDRLRAWVREGFIPPH